MTPSPTVTPTQSATHTWTETQTVTPSPTSSPSLTVSPTFAATPQFTLQLGVYNSAGELVVNLPSLAVDALPTSMTTSASAFIPGQGGALVIGFPGLAPSVVWNGTNANGQAVSGGIYIIEAVYRSPLGQTTIVSTSVQVTLAPTDVSIEVYNSAGERVRTLVTQVSENEAVVPSFSATALVPSLSTAGDSGLKIVVGSGGQAVWWNGYNDNGNPVTAGTYLVKVTWELNGAVIESFTKSITVLEAAAGDPLATAWLAPNPVPLDMGALEIGLDPSMDAAGLSGQVYTLDGILVEKLTPNAKGRLVWAFGGRGAAAGLYLIRLRMADSAGILRERTMKAALLR
jgi:flagellar hook assembly protein FlgD